MKTYIIKIKFADGDEAHIRCVANNQADALKKIENTSQFADFAKNKKLDSVVIEVEKTTPQKGEYLLQKSKDSGFWVATDTKNNCVIKFKEKAYNETAKVTFLYDIKADAMMLAAIIRGLGEFLAKKHSDII